MYGPWTPPPQYYPISYPIPSPASGNKDEYVKFLKKELKAAKTKDKPKDEKKDEKKKEFWKRTEFVAVMFLTAPLLGTFWIGMLKLSWMLAQNLLQH